MKKLFHMFCRGAYTLFTGDYSRPDDQPPDWREYLLAVLVILGVAAGVLCAALN